MKTLNFIYSTENDIEKLIKTGELSSEKEYLVLIHTCVHNKCNVMSLVKIILQYLPNSKIIGSGASGVVLGGELKTYCCMISVTEFQNACIRTCVIDLSDGLGTDI